jgi:hypothetical protein
MAITPVIPRPVSLCLIILASLFFGLTAKASCPKTFFTRTYASRDAVAGFESDFGIGLMIWIVSVT